MATFVTRSPIVRPWLSDHECRFGGRLKWVIADACGPLQDQVAKTGASAFANWAQAFKGLRSLLGFATSQVQNTNQLARALEYALEGQPLAKAWFQAVCEHQGVECTPRRAAWVAGMFGVHGTTTTIEDTLIAASLTPVIESDPAQLAGVWVPVG